MRGQGEKDLAAIFDAYDGHRVKGPGRGPDASVPTVEDRYKPRGLGYRLGDIVRYNRPTYNATMKREHPGTIQGRVSSV